MSEGKIGRVYQKQAGTDNRFVRNVTNEWESAYRAVRPEDPRANVHAYKNLPFVLSNLVASQVASANMSLYVTKQSTGKLANRTKAVSRSRLAYLQKSHHYRINKAVEIEEIVSHPFLDLVQSVNPYQNKTDLFELLSIFLDMTGNAYWYIVKDGLGVPTEIWNIPPQYMYVVPDKETFIKGYVMRSPSIGIDVPFEPEEIIHFKMPSTTSLYYGSSRLTAVSEAYNTGVNLDRRDVAFFSNMAEPSGVLTSNELVGQDVLKDAKKQFMQKHGGVKKAFMPMVLSGGLTWQQTSMAPKDLGLKDTRRDVLERMAQAWNVPIAKLITENVNKSNSEAAQTDFLRDGIAPRLNKIEEKINEQLMPMFGPGLFVAFEDVVPVDREFMLLERKTNIEIGYSDVNSERLKGGEDPYDDPIYDLPSPRTSQAVVMQGDQQEQQPTKTVKKKP